MVKKLLVNSNSKIKDLFLGAKLSEKYNGSQPLQKFLRQQNDLNINVISRKVFKSKFSLILIQKKKFEIGRKYNMCRMIILMVWLILQSKKGLFLESHRPSEASVLMGLDGALRVISWGKASEEKNELNKEFHVNTLVP